MSLSRLTIVVIKRNLRNITVLTKLRNILTGMFSGVARAAYQTLKQQYCVLWYIFTPYFALSVEKGLIDICLFYTHPPFLCKEYTEILEDINQAELTWNIWSLQDRSIQFYLYQTINLVFVRCSSRKNNSTRFQALVSRSIFLRSTIF